MQNIVSLLISDLGDDLFDVQSELNEAATNWRSIGIALRLKPDFLQSTETRYSSDPRACLSWMLMEWLMRNYNVKKFGEPTWQQLVKAVGHPAGGANMALAREIARRHKAAGGANVTVVGETTRKRKAASGANKTIAQETTRKHKAASGANITVAGKTRKRKAASGTNITVVGETTRKRKAASGANVARKMARKYKPEGMSTGDVLLSL